MFNWWMNDYSFLNKLIRLADVQNVLIMCQLSYFNHMSMEAIILRKYGEQMGQPL